MSAKLRAIELPEKVGEVDPDLIAELEAMLGWARLGKYQSVAFLTESNGELQFSVVGVKDRWRQLGFLTHMQHKLLTTP